MAGTLVTGDIVLATTLYSLGYDMGELVRDQSGGCSFTFIIPDGDDVLGKYYEGGVLVEPKEYHRAYKEIRTMITNA